MRDSSKLTPALENMRRRGTARLAPRMMLLRQVAESARASNAIEGIDRPLAAYLVPLMRRELAKEMRALRVEDERKRRHAQDG